MEIVDALRLRPLAGKQQLIVVEIHGGQRVCDMRLAGVVESMRSRLATISARSLLGFDLEISLNVTISLCDADPHAQWMR